MSVAVRIPNIVHQSVISDLYAFKNHPSPMQKIDYWDDVQSLSIEDQLFHFKNALVANDHHDIKKGFRLFAAQLLRQQQITMTQFVSVFGGHASYWLTQDKFGRFNDINTGLDASDLVGAYSRAKYGSVEDIRFLARMVISNLSQALNSPDSHWSRLFRTAKEHGDNVVLMTTGWRNVPSTANVLYEMVVEHINLKLAHLGLPTIINVKLPRIAPPCENYASLTTEERKRVNLVQDHVIPDRNFYQSSGVHVIFGDDVLVTGSTADKVFFESMRNGAKSFQAIYPVAIDPRLALTDATIEERLNLVAVSGQLDDTLVSILAHRHFHPILRTLRLVFAKANYESFLGFIPRVPADTWLRLYMAALGNEFLQQDDCKPSLCVLKDYLTNRKLLSMDGMADITYAPHIG